jgi:hypothetical protein
VTTGIVILAMVAAFLALRLYSVLGKRTGHEQPFVAPLEARPIVPEAIEDGQRAAPAPENEKGRRPPIA